MSINIIDSALDQIETGNNTPDFIDFFTEEMICKNCDCNRFKFVNQRKNLVCDNCRTKHHNIK